MSDKDVLLSINDVGFVYSSRTWGFSRFEYSVLKGVSFDICRGETLGVLGRNGCGKSSLLRLLNGVIKPTSGYIQRSTEFSSILLTLGLGFNSSLTGRDNALLSAMLQGFTREQAIEALPEIHEFSELGDFFDKPVSTYSSGMRSRLGFSTAIRVDVDLLLIDETLSVGDQHFKKKAEKALMNKIKGDQTVVFVSHSGKQIGRLCDRAVWIEAGVVQAIGDAKTVCKKYSDFMNSLDGNSDVAWAKRPEVADISPA